MGEVYRIRAPLESGHVATLWLLLPWPREVRSCPGESERPLEDPRTGRRTLAEEDGGQLLDVQQ